VLGQGIRYCKVTTSLLHLLTLLAEATITSRLVKPLLNVAFRQVVLSQIFFYFTSSFVASYEGRLISFSPS
jgi:hypothetical protein